MNISIREAREEDIDKLLPMTRAFHHAAQFSEYAEWNKEKWTAWLWTCINNDLGGCLVATNGTDLPVGFATVVASPSYWDPEIVVCQETVLWTVPEYRGNGIGIALIEAIVEWGGAHGCKLVAVGTQQNMAPKKTAIRYKKLGFELKEKAFVRRLECRG